MARWDEYGLKTGTSARDEVLILDSDTNTNKRITVGDIQEFANGKMLEKENATLNTEAKTLIGAINEVDAKNDAQDESLATIESKFPSYVKKTDVDSTLSVAGSPADAKVVGDSLKNEKSERQSEIDVERKRIDNVYANKLVTLDEIDLVTEEGFFVDALAVKELNSNLTKANSKITTTNTNLAKTNTVLENRKPIIVDSTAQGTVNLDTNNYKSLKSGITYAFIVTVSSNINSESYKQEINCALNNVNIGNNGNYYKLTSTFMGKCSKGDKINITSFKNGGSWTFFATRAIFIPVS